MDWTSLDHLEYDLAQFAAVAPESGIHGLCLTGRFSIKNYGLEQEKWTGLIAYSAVALRELKGGEVMPR